MQLIGQGDLVLRALFVLLSMMLLVSVYLPLSKGVDLACRAVRARRFLRRFEGAQSLQQMRALVDGQPTIDAFAQVAHCALMDCATGCVAREACAQAQELRRGLDLLGVLAWLAPLTGAVAAAWHLFAAHGLGGTAMGSPWAGGLVLVQLGLATALLAGFAHLALLLAQRRYLAQFAPFEHRLAGLLEPVALVGTGRPPAVRAHAGVPATRRAAVPSS